MPEDVRELTIKAERMEDKLHMRTNLATADFEDGRRVDIDVNVAGGSILISMQDPEEDGWVTYVIPAREFVEAVIKEEDWK